MRFALFFWLTNKEKANTYGLVGLGIFVSAALGGQALLSGLEAAANWPLRCPEVGQFESTVVLSLIGSHIIYN